MAGWQSSNLVVRDPARPGYERCAACLEQDTRELDEAASQLAAGDAGAQDRMQMIRQRMDSSWWRTAVWYARRKHISQCQLQTEENRARAQELLDRNAESNRRAEQKRKDREKEGREKELRRIAIVMKQGGDITTSPLYHYMDYIAPEVLERHGIDRSRFGRYKKRTPGQSAQFLDQPENATDDRTISATPSTSTSTEATSIPQEQLPQDTQPVKIKLTLAPEEEPTTSTPSSPSQSTFTPANTSLALPSTSSRLSAPPTTDDEASDVDTTLPNDTSGIANVDDDENAGDESQNDNGDAGYAAKLPFWVSANLVVRHPSSKDKETCVACLKDLEDERMRELRNPDGPDQREALQVIDQKIKDAYWLTNGNGRFRHMSECQHQTQDTRDKAKVRLDRYLAMARQRMKARHQREKEEKKKRLAGGAIGAGAGLTINTGRTGRGGANGGSGRQSSADQGTPEPVTKTKKMNPKKMAAMAMNEDLRALSIMPGKKKEAVVKGGKASVMNTYDNDYSDAEADLADLPPPMLHDSDSERSPSVPPEPVKTPHSVSFRATDEPLIYIKDALHPSLLNKEENSSFFAASASLYASQGDSSKITAQTFFDTPTDHSSGIGSRKRSPHHLYMRREETKRRRVTPDVSRRALMPPRTVKRAVA